MIYSIAVKLWKMEIIHLRIYKTCCLHYIMVSIVVLISITILYCATRMQIMNTYNQIDMFLCQVERRSSERDKESLWSSY